MSNPFLGAPAARRGRALSFQAPTPSTAPQTDIYTPTAASHSLQLNSAGNLQYPAPNASTVLLTYAVPAGQTLVISSMAIVNIGAALVDYQGALLWHVLRNGAGVKGFESMVAQVGSLQQPQPVNLIFNEGETLQVTVSVPQGQAAPAGNQPAARLLGFLKLAVPKPNLLPRG
jgi:hypothetical protein